MLPPFCSFPLHHDRTTWPWREKKTLLPDVEEELTVEVWHLLKTEEASGPHVSLDYTTVAHHVLSVEPSCPPAYKSHRCPMLINSFLICLSASRWIPSVPSQKNLHFTKSWNTLYGFNSINYSERGMLTAPPISTFVSSFFELSIFCFMHFEVLLLGTYIFRTIKYSD